MLKKSIGFSAAALAFGLMGVFANGCSSSSSPAPAGGTDADTSGDAKKPNDAGNPADTGPTTCYDQTLELALNLAPPQAYQNVCTTAQVAAYYTACLDTGATATTCSAFTDVNGTCSQCIDGNPPTTADGGVLDAGPSADGGTFLAPYPVLVPVSQTTSEVINNIDGCIAALSTGTASCDLISDQLGNCLEATCSNCTEGDDAAQTACLNAAEADTSGCTSVYVQDSTCQAAITASQTANATACGASSSASTFQEQYTAVANTLCGAHP